MESVAGAEACYLERLWRAEVYTAERLAQMARGKCANKTDTEALAARLERELGITYAPLQKKALALAAERQLLVITGGPGTGKTTSLRAILSLYDELGLTCLLTAPTGRAAKRLSELTGREASTIHRLLGAGYAPDGDELHFRKNEDDPLDCGACRPCCVPCRPPAGL